MNPMLRIALCATVIAAACGGGDPPGGGNGNGNTSDGGKTPGTDGSTGNGGGNGYVPNPSNPLIEVIPGTWEPIAIDLEIDDRGWIDLPPDDPTRTTGLVTVDRSDPVCTQGYPQPPGDACIDWPWAIPTHLVLYGDVVRYVQPSARYEGPVLNNGWLIELQQEWRVRNGCADWDEELGVCRSGTYRLRFRKLD